MKWMKSGNSYWYKYTDEELESEWENTQGQGNIEARDFNNKWCIVVKCTISQALALTRMFVERVFAIPSCCYYNGTTLSLYCGDAGSGATELLTLTRLMCDAFLHKIHRPGSMVELP